MIERMKDGSYQVDDVIDACMVGLWKFGMHPVDSPKIMATIEIIRERLWVETEVGGLARYENDRCHQVSQDIENVPGNPWYICTLWLSEWYTAVAKTEDDLDRSKKLMEWTAE